MKAARAPQSTQGRVPALSCLHSGVSTESWPPEILVVADGSGILPTIGAMLQCRGFQVILAPDAQTALEEIGHYDVAAVIAGASGQQEHGLDLLGAVKAQRSEVKTLVVTQRLNPVLPARAYEMDIDDYLHWPLSGAELSSRLQGLLKPARERTAEAAPRPMMMSDCRETLTALHFLMDGCTQVLWQISRTVEEMVNRHVHEMSPELGQELQKLAVLVQTMSRRLCQIQPQPAAEHGAAGPCPHRCH